MKTQYNMLLQPDILVESVIRNIESPDPVSTRGKQLFQL